MALPAQFQLGLELTNIVNPLSQALSALGSLALVDAIKKSGSDIITEMKLASLIGRHRIDDVIKFHFRVLVAKADQSVISRYMDIVLESGSGPTVQEAMKNPALFSMVIQLSGLAFAHEDESLASAMVEAIDRIVRESGGDTGDVPDYVSLLGTLRACQQQTAAFQWAALYEAVEQKIQRELRIQDRGESQHHSKRGAKRRKVNEQLIFDPTSVSDRGLPFPILQGLVMWLHSLQRFPEHRFLHLRCDSGISTVVVWCHQILGLGVTVSINGCEIYFGDGSSNILVEETDSQHVNFTLMDPRDGDRNSRQAKLTRPTKISRCERLQKFFNHDINFSKPQNLLNILTQAHLTSLEIFQVSIQVSGVEFLRCRFCLARISVTVPRFGRST